MPTSLAKGQSFQFNFIMNHTQTSCLFDLPAVWFTSKAEYLLSRAETNIQATGDEVVNNSFDASEKQGRGRNDVGKEH